MNEIILTFHYNLYTHLYFYFWVFIFGAIVGSFLNVVIFRLFSGESIIFPPSHCNSCGERIKWYDNIPLFSYFVLLRGKCRNCKAKISIQYPLIEFICAVLFLLIFMKYEFSWQTLFLMYLGAASIVLCATDFKEQVVYDVISIPIIPIGILYSYLNIAHNDTTNFLFFNMLIPDNLISSLFGIAIGFLFFEIISLISKLFLKHRAFGEGDTIIAMGIGAWFGVNPLILTLILAFSIQAVFSFPLIMYKFYQNNDKASIINYCGLLSSIFIIILAYILGLMSIWIISLLISIISFGIAIFFILRILRNLRENEHEFTLFPFGPALLFGMAMVVAFYPFFSNLVKIYFGFAA